MVKVTGKSGVKRYFAELPEQIQSRLLRGAARAGAKVFADDMRANVASDDVRATIKVRTKADAGHVTATAAVTAKGFVRSKAWWLEYGTSPHFISVDDSQRGGLSIGRVNKKVADGSLVIGGKFVGATVFHPGARPHPFVRPARDTKEDEAMAAARGYIASRVRSGGIVGTDEGDAG